MVYELYLNKTVKKEMKIQRIERTARGNSKKKSFFKDIFILRHIFYYLVPFLLGKDLFVMKVNQVLAD